MKRVLVCILLACLLLSSIVVGAIPDYKNTRKEAESAIVSNNNVSATMSSSSPTTTIAPSTVTKSEPTITAAPTTQPTIPTTTTTTKKTTKETTTTTKQTTFTVKDKVMLNVPLYDQTKYKHVPYGKYGTVSSHGCGIVCIAMIASYLKDKEYTPEVLAPQFGKYNTAQGSLWSLFENASKELDLGYEGMTYSKEEALKALSNGHLVISAQKNSVFSEGGHFILLTGISEDGKIFVNDPYGPNWTKNEYMKNGYKNGFTQKDVCSSNSPYWIYGKKQ